VPFRRLDELPPLALKKHTRAVEPTGAQRMHEAQRAHLLQV
jgi:hypothetical protein